MRESKKRNNPYANIQWKKAAALFTKQPEIKKGHRAHLRVRDLLAVLMKVGEIGLTLIFESRRQGVAFLHPGIDVDWRLRQMLRQMEKRRFVRVIENQDASITAIVTKRGMVRALTYQLESMTISHPQSWDKKWRLVIFDIPVKFNRVRDIFRMRLRQLELYRLQESVYVSPYPCFDEVEFLRELYGVSFTVRYLLVEKIEEDAFLKQHFHLV